MKVRRYIIVIGGLAPVCFGQTQEATASFEVPITLSGGAMYTQRLQSDNPKDAPYSAAFRAVISPSLKLGPHWFFYSALQVNSTPYFYYDASYAEEQSIGFRTLQAFVGYSTSFNNISLLVKAGRLSSAFGSFPLQYDDARNPLIDQPVNYVLRIPLRPDELPCGTADLLSQKQYASQYGGIWHWCGGNQADAYGLLPATLYGLIGIEAELSIARLDARLQITNSSPANPQSLTSGSQYVQWTAGGGYTIRTGLRIGMSAFRGPYMDNELDALLPRGTTARDYPATGLGADVQWSRGRWSMTGEWQRFQFDSPHFVVAPAVYATYGEAKAILSTRNFVAMRVGLESFSRVKDTSGVSASHWSDSYQVYEFAYGFRPNRHQLIKASYEWVRGADIHGTQDNVLGIQFVTSFTALPVALR